MMARLLREHRSDHLIASQLRCVVTLVSGELAHKIGREGMLPRKRRHVVIQAAPEILPFFLLIRKIRHVELLTVEEHVEANQVLVAWRVVEFEKALYHVAVVMKVLYRRRIKEAISSRAGRAREVAELTRVTAHIE